MKLFNTRKPLALLVLLGLLLAGFASVSEAAPERTVATNSDTIQIKGVRLSGEGAETELVIEVSRPVTYTSYKTMSPNRLVIDFSQAVMVDSVDAQSFENAPVSKVTARRFETEAGVLTRMELYLTQDLEPVITPSVDRPGEISVRFPNYILVAAPKVAPAETVEIAKPADEPAAAPPIQPDQTLSAPVAAEPAPAIAESKPSVLTDVVMRDGAVEILVDGPLREYKTMRLSRPERLVIDLFDVQAGSAARLITLNGAGLSTARIGASQGKVRVVLDAINGSLPDAVYERTEQGIKVSLPGAPANPVQPVVMARKAIPEQAEHKAAAAPPATVEPAAARIEAIDFQVVDGISRISVKTTGNPVVEQPVKSPGFVTLRIKNTQLPIPLQRSLESREFPSAVLRVTPVQARTKSGQDALLRVAMRSESPATLRREADMLYLEIKNPESAKQQEIALPEPANAQKAAPASSVEQLARTEEKQAGSTGRYVGRKVTLEFADAEVRKIFQLLSEVSNKNFVLGDEVTGNISLKLVNVPWDQALDIILDTKGLEKREDGNIVLIRGKGRLKSVMDEQMEIRKSALKSEPLTTKIFVSNYADLAGIVTQFNALKTDRGIITQDARTNKVIVKDVQEALDDMEKLLKTLDVPEKQVMIEARIVEASTSFTRSLGINWGLHTTPNAGGDRWPFVNSLHSVFGGLASTSAPTSGVSGQSGSSTDITFGTIGANIKLSMRINAAATAGLIRVISSPKVATLNNKSAKITQGQQIPYTAISSDKAETKFVEAALSLEVTPHINNNGTIIMKIDAKNDSPGPAVGGGALTINKKQATTEMLLRDGETTVIGGIYVDRDITGEEGVPWLMNIPFLGTIFKSKNVEKTKTELLIFITPRIITNSFD